MHARTSRMRSLAALALWLPCVACAYRGAIYASYQEAGLGIKASAESNSPIKVHFGYDRGVGAWVPRRGGSDEEVTSLISRDDVRAGVNPTKLDEPLLQMDGAVITGTAAIVASAPTNANVKVTEAGNVLEVKTTGAPGQRLATALSTVELTDVQVEQRDLITATAALDDADVVFRTAAAKTSDRFQQLFRQRVNAGDRVPVAFKRAVFAYENEVDDPSARVAEVTAALTAARK